MILSDREIEAALELQQIKIEPRPDKSLWTSTAIALTLDGVLLKWKRPEAKPSGEKAGPRKIYPTAEEFSVQKMTESEEFAERFTIPAGGHPLQPREFILGYTQQSIYLPTTSRLAARVEGKSSLARLGVGVHVTAPTIHAGFGYNKARPHELGLPIQLEIFNLGEFIVHLTTGMPICQLILEEVREVPTKGYAGRFSEQEAFRAEE